MASSLNSNFTVESVEIQHIDVPSQPLYGKNPGLYVKVRTSLPLVEDHPTFTIGIQLSAMHISNPETHAPYYFWIQANVVEGYKDLQETIYGSYYIYDKDFSLPDSYQEFEVEEENLDSSYRYFNFDSDDGADLLDIYLNDELEKKLGIEHGDDGHGHFHNPVRLLSLIYEALNEMYPVKEA